MKKDILIIDWETKTTNICSKEEAKEILINLVEEAGSEVFAGFTIIDLDIREEVVIDLNYEIDFLIQ